MPSVEFLLFNFHSICHPWLCDTKGLKVCCQNDSSLGSIKRSSCPILDLGPLMLAFSNCFTHLFKPGFLFTLAKIKPTMCAFLWANVYIFNYEHICVGSTLASILRSLPGFLFSTHLPLSTRKYL